MAHTISFTIHNPDSSNPWMMITRKNAANKRSGRIKIDTKGLRWITAKARTDMPISKPLNWLNVLRISNETRDPNSKKASKIREVRTLALDFGGVLKNGERIIYLSARGPKNKGAAPFGNVILTVGISPSTIRLAKPRQDMDKAPELTWDKFGVLVNKKLVAQEGGHRNVKYLRKARP